MVAKFVLTIAVVCTLAQVSLCFVKRDAPTETMQLPTLEEVRTKTEEAFQNVQSGFHKIVGVENNEELVKKMKDGTDSLTQSFNNFIGKLGEEAKAHGVTDWINSAAEQIKTKFQELEAAHPDVSKQAEEVKTKFQDTLQTIISEAGKISQEIGKSTEGMNDQLKQLTSEVLTHAQTVASDVQASIDNIAKNHEATHAATR